MTVEEALYAQLAGDSGVSANAGGRIYPLVIPQDATLPALAYQRISGPRMAAHDGPAGLATARLQVTCTAASYSEAKALAAAVRECVDARRGEWGGLSVDECRVENEYDGYGFAGEQATVRVDLLVLYRE